MLISIHTPAKGVTKKGRVHMQLLYISIHTPAKGVTLFNPISMETDFISIHTPAKGVTALSSCSNSAFVDFNPHSREGSDLLQEIKLTNS